MFQFPEIPDCVLPNKPTLIPPLSPTPNHSLYLSNLDDQKFLRFSIKYLLLYRKSPDVGSLKRSLSVALVGYYPLAGRLRVSPVNEEKLEVDCNGEGALFAEAVLDLTVEEFKGICEKPNKSWRKLLYRTEGQSFLSIPPLVVQVTHLKCGGSILCLGICHCLCDGIGSAQFLHAWADICKHPNQTPSSNPCWERHLLKPRNPLKIEYPHIEFTQTQYQHDLTTPFDLDQVLKPETLVPTSHTFHHDDIFSLKQLCNLSLKCTSFEVLSAHVWSSWAKAMCPPSHLKIKLLFSVNIRKTMRPNLPQGYYGNGFVLGCAETTVKELVHGNLSHIVRLIQRAKSRLTDDYVKSMVDYLGENRVKPDLSLSLVISQWTRLGMERVDFGEGMALFMGPLCSEIYCIFFPVYGDSCGVTVLMSVPESGVESFGYWMKNFREREMEGEGEKKSDIFMPATCTAHECHQICAHMAPPLDFATT
ncbi:hypothetical protein AMTRI_Chr03g48280 [Amborella trichopoda]